MKSNPRWRCLPMLMLLAGWTTPVRLCSAVEPRDHSLFLIDAMDTVPNALKGRCAVYQQPPDRILFSKADGYGRVGNGLRLTFHKINVGGAYGQGGWIGYYTMLQVGGRYFDASSYTHLTFWVRGEEGGERFQVGIADKPLSMMQDTIKSKPIGDYLPAGRITREWQKAVVPLTDMFVDYELMASISLCFEAALYDEEEVRGTVYVDDLAFEKNPEL
ncbi:MAG: hypothetical protein JXB04_13040 [Kiritimatiellae bacterium]|nr:hypothetical protein [Kiritimatiellia bacterium]